MIIKGILKGDRTPLELFFGTEKKCKSWIHERDLYLFTSLSLCDDSGKEVLKIK